MTPFPAQNVRANVIWEPAGGCIEVTVLPGIGVLGFPKMNMEEKPQRTDFIRLMLQHKGRSTEERKARCAGSAWLLLYTGDKGGLSTEVGFRKKSEIVESPSQCPVTSFSSCLAW